MKQKLKVSMDLQPSVLKICYNCSFNRNPQTQVSFPQCLSISVIPDPKDNENIQ